MKRKEKIETVDVDALISAYIKKRLYDDKAPKNDEPLPIAPPFPAKPSVDAVPQSEDLSTPNFWDTVEPRRNWWLFGKKSKAPYLFAKVVMPNKTILMRKVWITPKMAFMVGSNAYGINEKAIITERIAGKLRPMSYYFFGDPNPIIFDTQKRAVINPEIFKDLLDSKLIQDLVKPQNAWLMLIVFLLVIVNTIISVVIVMKQFGMVGKGG
jgi:hypothetical protein